MEKRFQKKYPEAQRNVCPAGGEAAALFHKVYSQDVRLPEEIGSRVKILSCIAYSEKQQVYLVKDRKGRRLILKLAQGERISFIRQDAVVLREQSFSFLPRYVYYTEKNENGYLLREYIEGDTLWEWVNKRGPFRSGEAGDIMCRLCGMVDQFHRQEPAIIHRDIKPQNIVLTAEKNLFMIDMGTARKYRENSTQDTVLIGSRPTAAPEQYGYRQTDARSDIYALGVLYFFLLTGSMNAQELRFREAVPYAVRKIIEKCTKMDPDDRYQSCRELRRAIARLQDGTGHKKVRYLKKAAAGVILAQAAVFWKKRTEIHKADERNRKME